MESTLITILDGVSFGMILFLIAAGLSLVMGVMGILNLAHGALFMLGAYLGWTVTVDAGASFWVGLIAAGAGIALFGVLLERGLLRRMQDQLDNQVLATLGVLFMLTNLSIWIWTAEAKPPYIPPAFDGAIDIFGTGYPKSRIAVIVAGALIAAALWIVQERTRLGTMVRAGMDDRETAACLGVNVGLVSTVVFGLAAFVVGISGVLGQQLVGVQPDHGLNMLLLALIVLIVGGIGTIQGALVGALAVGLIRSVGLTLFPSFELLLVYGAVIVVLIVRPSGLLGRPTAVQ
jgi:branched-chain amino acid transport system permease protein